MFKTRKIELLIKYSLVSGFMKRDIAPLSLMIIAPPESNKTTILKQFEDIKNAKYTTDLSSKPLIEFLQEVSKTGKYYHLIVPDFIKIVKHNYVTVSSVITTLNSVIEEGMKTSMYYGLTLDLKKNVKIGLLTGITPGLYKQQFKLWNDIGFISRFLPVSYEYSEETRREIMKMISGDGQEPLDETLTKIRKSGPKVVAIDKEFAEGIRLYCEELVKKLRTFYVYVTRGDQKFKAYYDIQGFRLLKQMRLLAQCIAYDKGYDKVNYECLADLKDLIEYIGMPDNPKVI